jgi:hypothetical protein
MEHHPPSIAGAVAGRCGCLEVRLAGTPEAAPNYKMTEHWWAC